MGVLQNLGDWGEQLPLPDFVTRAGIATLVGRTDRRLRQADVQPDSAFVREMADFPIAQHADAAPNGEPLLLVVEQWRLHLRLRLFLFKLQAQSLVFLAQS